MSNDDYPVSFYFKLDLVYYFVPIGNKQSLFRMAQLFSRLATPGERVIRCRRLRFGAKFKAHGQKFVKKPPPFEGAGCNDIFDG